MSFHRGLRHPGFLRFYTGSIFYKREGRHFEQKCFVVHPLRSLLGVSFRGRWFLGLMRFDPSKAERQDDPAGREAIRQESDHG